MGNIFLWLFPQKNLYGANVIIFEGIMAFAYKELRDVSEKLSWGRNRGCIFYRYILTCLSCIFLSLWFQIIVLSLFSKSLIYLCGKYPLDSTVTFLCAVFNSIKPLNSCSKKMPCWSWKSVHCIHSLVIDYFFQD